MKVVPKPEGFDLRSRRADKEGDSSKWEPMDVLYEAHREMTNTAVPIDCAMVIWREQCGDGKTRIRQRRAGSGDSITTTLINAAGDWMGWGK